MQLTIREAASLLRVPGATVHRWIRERGLPAVKFNEQYRLNPVDLVGWAQSHRIAIDPDWLAARQPPPPPIADALLLGGIHREVPGKGRRPVLEAVIANLPLPSTFDRELLTEVLCARENLGSMDLGRGIAIPQARHPIVHALGTPMLSLNYLQHELEFGAADRRPVQTLCILITPTIRMHLQFLARLVFALSGEFGDRVVARAGDAAIVDALRAADRAAPPVPAPEQDRATP